ncbi:MAG: 50S ribosomal protein L17 [Bacteroidota bacterium]
MRHGKKFNHLGRKTAHRSAMLANMATSLILHKRIKTTVAKAKALRQYIEPLLTKSKKDDTHSRRVVFSYLQDKYSVTELFNTVAAKIADRPGGYTRIIKTGTRLGDNAEMCIMELVDFNELLLEETSTAKTKTRRSRRGGKAKSANEDQADATKVSEEVTTEEAEVVAVENDSDSDDVIDEAAVVEDNTSEQSEVTDSAEAAADESEEPSDDEKQQNDEKKEDK